MEVPDLDLPDVSNQLVTADNPARTDVSGMDHTRCAALHNYLVSYAWIAEGRQLASLHAHSNTFFTMYGAAAEALRPRLDPSLSAFLDTALLPPADAAPRPAPFFFWVSQINSPDYLFDNQAADLLDEPEDSLLCLYDTNIGQGGESGGGLFYHQGYQRAAVFMHMDDYDYAFPVKVHPELWHPLETVLSNWIDLVHLGKITASPTDTPALFGGEKIGPWEWQPYSEAQVSACVGAWDRLCDAIEARRISSILAPTTATTTTPATTSSSTTKPEPLVLPALLDTASVPSTCFARAFLTRARRPTTFRSIAPGLLLPPTDAAEFVATQPFTKLPHTSDAIIPPVCLFSTAQTSPQASLTTNPFSTDGFYTGHDKDPSTDGFYTGPAPTNTTKDPPPPSTLPSSVPAGVYTEAVDRRNYDIAEEGFRLLLPYTLNDSGGRDWHCDTTTGNPTGNARKSDGSFVGRGTSAELFQHGYKPFGGDYYRPQRLERLLELWWGLVVEGVWTVGETGVEGGVERFGEAGGYVIPPSW